MNVLMKKSVVEALNVVSGEKKAKKAFKKYKAEELQALSKITLLIYGKISEAVEDRDPDTDTDEE